MKDLRLYLRLRQDLRDYLLEGVAGAPELAAGELAVDEHRNSGCPVSQRAFYSEGLDGRKPWCLVVYEQAQGIRYGKHTARGRAVSIRSISIQVFPINGAWEEPASREAMISAMDANVARTSGTRRSLNFWATTSRYRLKEYPPLMVTIMAMVGVLSSEVKGTPKFHSKTAAASDTEEARTCEA